MTNEEQLELIQLRLRDGVYRDSTEAIEGITWLLELVDNFVGDRVKAQGIITDCLRAQNILEEQVRELKFEADKWKGLYDSKTGEIELLDKIISKLEDMNVSIN